MRRAAFLIALVALLLIGGLEDLRPTTSAQESDERIDTTFAAPPPPATVEGRYFVRMAPGAPPGLRQAVQRTAAAGGLDVRYIFADLGWASLEEKPGAAPRPFGVVAALLRARPDVLEVQAVTVRHLDVPTPVQRGDLSGPLTIEVTDPLIWEQWGRFRVNALDAWEITEGAGVIVAVIDSGVDYTHADLNDNIWSNTGEIASNMLDDDGNGFVDDIRGWDFSDNDADPQDEYTNVSHGTHVAGTIAAERNGVGGTGVAPATTIMPLRACTASGSCPDDDTIAAINYAVANGADVINMSLGGPATTSPTDPFKLATEAAIGAGVIVVASAGNSGTEQLQDPANFVGVIGVAALTPGDGKASFSTTGTHVDFAAPGVAELSTVRASIFTGERVGGFAFLSGTSMAAPHVSGIVALLLAQNPGWQSLAAATELTNVVNRLIVGAEDLGTAGLDTSFGNGGVDAYASLTNGKPPPGASMTLDLPHTWIGDLVITLDTPGAGGTLTLFSRPGRNGSGFGSSENDIDLRYSLPPSLAFPAAGTWTLFARDHATSNQPSAEAKGLGTINAWSVTLGDQTTALAGTPVTVPDADRQGQTVTPGEEVTVTLVVADGDELAITLSRGGGAATIDFGTVAAGAVVDTTGGDPLQATNVGAATVDLLIEYRWVGANCGLTSTDWTPVALGTTADTDKFAMGVSVNDGVSYSGIPADGSTFEFSSSLTTTSVEDFDLKLETPNPSTVAGPCEIQLVIAAIAS